MSDKSSYYYEFWIDRGGTFTDIVACRSDGRLFVRKLLSENSSHYQDAALAGIKEQLEVSGDSKLPASMMIRQIKMGTTVATNALLERKGDPTLLVVNDGFADILQIGYQNRPDLFARHIKRPDNLHQSVLELPGRINSSGEEIEPFSQNIAREKLSSALENGIRSCAIVFMNSYLNSEHELLCERIAREVGFEHVAISSVSSPLVKIVFRGDTTVADAYLTPVLNRYVESFTSPFEEKTKIYFMQSNGGLVDRHHFSGKDSLLSGPAGGVVGAVKTCENLGFRRVIGFDMGGTSTDVSHYDGKYEVREENLIAGVRVRAPVIDIHTVAAGGGSKISFDGQRFRVGPESAGAAPGPACYKNGGPLTITDCNVFLGRIQEDDFPKVFGASGKESIDTKAVELLFSTLHSQVNQVKIFATTESIAWGFLEIAVEKMAQAIKKITIERGYDIKDHALASFGGAGGQHACLIAEKLGIKTVIIHPLAGVLSAVGIGLSDVKAIEPLSIQKTFDKTLIPELEKSFQDMMNRARAKLQEQVENVDNTVFQKKLLIRYQGSDTTLEILSGSYELIEANFHESHAQRFGFSELDKPLIVDSLRLEASVSSEERANSPVFDHRFDEIDTKPGTISSLKRVKMYSKGEWHDTPVLARRELAQDKQRVGPIIIMDDTSTNIIEPGWQVRVAKEKSLIIERIEEANSAQKQLTNEAKFKSDPILLELFNNKFMAIAEEMGVTLRNTSHSVNIKERLDFSCALFDREGRLIANAPHMPVHLGSMGASVQSVVKDFAESMKEGDSYILNNPYNGGTHLPDITIITPVYITPGKDSSPSFFTASRGHHADIGGITPGSMPPRSRHIEEEGILIDPTLLVRDGTFLQEKISAILSAGPYPARNIEQNIADLKAQVAANRTGVIALNRLVEAYSLEFVDAYMEFIRANAEHSVRKAISSLSDGSFELPTDSGARIKVTIKVNRSKKEATIDFTGTSGEQETNFNAPASITRAAVLYVFRTLVEDQIPLNDGCLAPLKIILPEKCMLNPSYPRAVVAGNVETSQAIVDALYGALGTMAASQGTMNNFTFGNENYQYYETICGGSGAGYNHPGTDAIQTHMTNSRLTDPEILEWRYPVILREFSICRDSGGKGQYRGGDGAKRVIEFQEPMTASILSQRRTVAPFGLKGGGEGKPGKNYVIRRSGSVVKLSGTDSIQMEAGDRFVIETPGGGGYGERNKDRLEPHG